MNETDNIIDLGFYGKLPAYGDFIQKRLPTDFINPWHEWLQSGMLACRDRDPQGWKTYYLNCPAWSFVLSAGVCGQQAVAGVTIPSVDRVGRYFNFTLASMLPEGTNPATFAYAHRAWLEDLESLALSILEEEMDQDGISNAINVRSAELHWETPAYMLVNSGHDFTKVVSNGSAPAADMMQEITHQLLLRDQDKYGLWWHQGSSQVSAQLVSCANMPSEQIYLSLMMDDDLIAVTEPEDQSQPAEVNYMDDILSD